MGPGLSSEEEQSEEFFGWLEVMVKRLKHLPEVVKLRMLYNNFDTECSAGT